MGGRRHYSDSRTAEAASPASKNPTPPWSGSIVHAVAFCGSAHELVPRMLSDPDSENGYLFGTSLAFCGETGMALQLLKSAVEGHYCSYPALQKDPQTAPPARLARVCCSPPPKSAATIFFPQDRKLPTESRCANLVIPYPEKSEGCVREAPINGGGCLPASSFAVC